MPARRDTIRGVIDKRNFGGFEMLGSLFRSGPDVRRPGSFFAAFHLKLHRLTFLQRIKVDLLKAAAMEENLLTIG